MIKGVNKNIVEINNTDDFYIEKAILFINPKARSIDESKIISHAKKYVHNINKPTKHILKTSTDKKFLGKISYKTLNTILKFLSAMVIGFVICLLIIK